MPQQGEHTMKVIKDVATINLELSESLRRRFKSCCCRQGDSMKSVMAKLIEQYVYSKEHKAQN